MSLYPLGAVKDPKKKKQVEYSDLGIFFVLSFFGHYKIHFEVSDFGIRKSSDLRPQQALNRLTCLG